MIYRKDVLKTRFIVNFMIASNLYLRNAKSKTLHNDTITKALLCEQCPGQSCRFQMHNVIDFYSACMCIYNTSIIINVITWYKSNIKFFLNQAKSIGHV